MHFLKKYLSSLLLLTGIVISNPMAGMKRTVEWTNPLAVANVSELPREILYVIIRYLPRELKALCLVSKLWHGLTSQSNIAELLFKDDKLLQKIHFTDIIMLLRNCLRTNNTILYKTILDHSSPVTIHPCYHQQLLLQMLHILTPQTLQFLVNLCPNHNFKNNGKHVYNKALFWQANHLSSQLSDETLSSLVTLLGCDNKENIVSPQPFGTDKEGPIICQNLVANRKEVIAKHIEEIWINNKEHAIKHIFHLLQSATLLNNTDMVKTILNTTPFKTHFNRSPDYLYPWYHLALHTALDCDNREIWTAILTQVNPVINTIFTNTPIVYDCIARNQYWQLRMLTEKIDPLDFIDSLINATYRLEGWRLENLCAAGYDLDKFCQYTTQYNPAHLFFCKAVAHEADTLLAPSPEEENYVLVPQIKALKKENPVLFEKVHTVCHCALTSIIKNIIIVAILGKEKLDIDILKRYLENNRSTLPLVLSILQELRELCRTQLTTTIDLNIVEKITLIDNVIKLLPLACSSNPQLSLQAWSTILSF